MHGSTHFIILCRHSFTNIALIYMLTLFTVPLLTSASTTNTTSTLQVLWIGTFSLWDDFTRSSGVFVDTKLLKLRVACFCAYLC